jgi:glycosyl transferase family 1
MKILFVLDRRANAGSIQSVHGYQRAADAMGHTVATFGAADQRFAGLRMSVDADSFDHVVFIFESTLNWLSGLRLSHLLNRIPRERRVILDADGMYNDVISVDGYDHNHPNESTRIRWKNYCEALTDRIFQPTRRPLCRQAAPILFYGYAGGPPVQPASAKRWDVLHVGHNWWRWRQVGGTLMPALERIRPRLGGIGFVGSWWDAPPVWAAELGLSEAFACDPAWMRRIGVQIVPPVPYADVVATMSTARINILSQRPLFLRLGFVTAKYFEVFCADTIPLLMVPPDQAEEVYGPAGRELVLTEPIEDKLLDVLKAPERYRRIVADVRSVLAARHSYRRRLQELVAELECGRSVGTGVVF